MAYAPNGIQLKIFVKEQTENDSSNKCDIKRKFIGVGSLSGEKAKQFYEDVTKESSSRPLKGIPIKSKLKRTKQYPSKVFREVDLLVMSQNNDVKNLNLFFSQSENCNVNVTDDFGWTPLMCASCSGAVEAVKLLLENGADPSKCDNLGNTALKLAEYKNHKNIMKILEDFNKPQEKIEEGVAEPSEPFYCDVCKEMFQMNKIKHESSTLHLFNCRLKSTTFYGIPETNKGFQLLLKEGWNKETGLGPNGTGRKFPIKAFPKKDRKGIGAPQSQPNNNKTECQHTEKYENKKQYVYKKWKEKEFEKNFRLEFS